LFIKIFNYGAKLIIIFETAEKMFSFFYKI